MSGGDNSESGIKRCRYACTFCSEKKIKCDGCNPCSQCKKRHKECVYMTKKKTTQKVRRTEDYPPLSHSASIGLEVHGPDPSPTTTQPLTSIPPNPAFGFHAPDPMSSASRLLPRTHVIPGAMRTDLSSTPVSFGAAERNYLQQYVHIVNSFVPLVPASMIRDAMNPISLDCLGVTVQKIDQVKQAACKAAMWGAVSMGASISHDPAAEAFLRTAVSNLRECFDFPCREAFCAYLVVAEAYCMLGDRPSFLRYVSFADLIRREITQDLGIDCDVAMNHIRAQCFNATKGRRRIGKFVFPDFAQLAKYPTNLQAVSIIDFVLVSIMELMDNPSDEISTRQSYLHFVSLLEPLKIRLEFEGAQQSNPVALLVCMSILGFVLTKVERIQDGLMLLRAVLDLAEAAPHLVCMPLTWHSVALISKCFSAIGQQDLADRLQLLLQPNAHKWAKPHPYGNLPLTGGVLGTAPVCDVKDVLIRDIIESFARNAHLASSMPQNEPSKAAQTKRETGNGTDGARRLSSSDENTSRSSSEDNTYSLPKPPAELPAMEPSVAASAAMGNVRSTQLLRSFSGQSDLSFGAESLGDLIYDEIVGEPFNYDMFPPAFTNASATDADTYSTAFNATF